MDEWKHRIEALEGNQSETKAREDKVLEILHKIERRLIGNIEQDAPGLIDDVRALRHSVESIEVRLLTLEKVTIPSRLEILERGIQTVHEEIEVLNKYRFILYGGIAVAAFIFTKFWEYLVGKK